MTSQTVKIAPAEGKLGVLVVGLGAVTTTFLAGVEAIRTGLKKPFGSMTQMGRIRLGKRTEKNNPLVRDFVPLADLKDLEFCVWDLYPENAYNAAMNAQVLSKDDINAVAPFLKSISPVPAVFDEKYVRNLDGTHRKTEKSKWDQAQALMADIAAFKKKSGCTRTVMIWCASTEAFNEIQPVHQSLSAFEAGLKESHPAISPSMIYAYAALKSETGFANGAPNLTVDTPALLELAELNRLPLSGKDFKTGQTLMKTVIAPGLKSRYLGVRGWFSMNILGNRDGAVLDHPDNFKTKEESKLSVLDTIFQSDLYPDLYGDIYHKVRINYYPPRNDDKESWDNIDIFGWMGYPMQLKVNFLCKDSILAAPLVLDLILFTDLAQRAGMKGIQEWMSFFYKSPMVAKGLYPEHNLFIQEMKLKNTLRYLMGEDQITHLGLDYYQ